MNRRRLCVVGTCLCLMAGSVRADVLIDFEQPGFVVGSSVQALSPTGVPVAPPVSGINPDAQAFSIRDAGTSEFIVNFGGVHGKVWRVDRATGNLQTRPHSPHAGFLPTTTIKQFSGESTAIDDFGSETPTTNTFYAQLDFRAVDGANGFSPGGFFDFYSNVGDDGRHSYVRVIDDGSAFDLRFFDTGVGGFGDFQAHDVDLNLAYDQWHTVGMGIEFIDGQNVDGTGNDIVTYFVNGVPVFTGTSWETGYRLSTSSVRGLDRLAFRSVIDSGPGLYFDNIQISDVIPQQQVTPIPEPTSLAIWSLVGLGGAAYGWRRRKDGGAAR